MTGKKNAKGNNSKRFYKSRKDKMIDGVCGGLAEFLGIDANIVRVVWLLSIFVKGLGLIAYILAMIIVPVNPEHHDLKLEEKRKRNPAFFWGLLLIILGFIFLHDHFDLPYEWRYPWHFRHFPWWGISWGNFWPLVFVVLGVAYIIYILRKEKQTDASKGTARRAGEEPRKLVRTTENKMIGGVCSGFARYFTIDPTIVRIGLVILALVTDVLLWVIIYAFLVIALPQEKLKGTQVK